MLIVASDFARTGTRRTAASFLPWICLHIGRRKSHKKTGRIKCFWRTWQFVDWYCWRREPNNLIKGEESVLSKDLTSSGVFPDLTATSLEYNMYKLFPYQRYMYSCMVNLILHVLEWAHTVLTNGIDCNGAMYGSSQTERCLGAPRRLWCLTCICSAML